MLVKPKIAVFIPTLHGGGAERAMILFAQTATQLGCDVDLICAEKKGSLLPLVENQLSIIDLKAPRMLKAIGALRAYIKKHKPEVIFSTIVHANLAVLLASRCLSSSTRIVLRESNSPLTEQKKTWSRRISHFLTPRLYSKAHAVISVSQSVHDELLRLAPKLKEKSIVLNTPVVPEDFISRAAEDPQHPWFEPGTPPIVLGVGRLHPQKNFPLLIRAFAQTRATKECRLVILGEGKLRPELEALVDQLNLRADVLFAGFNLNPFSFMSRASAFVLSSDYEGMPNVLIQAMALGTPVVSTDCPGGSAECLEGGKFGILVPKGDVQEMSIAISKALESPRRLDIAERITQKYGAIPTTRAYLKLAGINL